MDGSLRRRTVLLAGLTSVAFARRGTAAERGGVLRAGIDAEPASLDPYFYRNFEDRSFYNLFYDNLVIQAGDGTIRPMLATSWETGAEGKTLTLKLRDGIRFHDGTPFDADAVKFNLDRLLDAATAAPARNYVDDLAAVEVVDPLTARLNLKRPSGVLLSALAIEPGAMASPTAVRKYGKDFGRNPVGTGPFVFSGWAAGEIEAKRSDSYWQTGEGGKPLPYLDGVRIRIVPIDSVRILELRSGNLDIINRIEPKDFEQIRRNPALQLLDHNQLSLQYLAFNTTKPPFDNIELRKAVSLAIDRKAVERLIAGGEGVVATGILPPTDWAFSKDLKGHTTDLAAAREAYASSKFKGEVVLSVIQRQPDVPLSELIQAMLRAAGIPARVEVLERQAWLNKVLGKAYQFGLVRATLPRPDPDMVLSTYYGPNASNNYSGISDPVILDALARARAATDHAQRAVLYHIVEQRLLDHYYQTFLAWSPIRDAASSKLGGFEREFAGTWLYTRMFLQT